MIDFYDTISAHIAWKKRLGEYIEGTGETLDSEEVCRDDRCALGRWIYAHEASFKTVPEYKQMRILHANFHQCAGDVIRLADQHQKEKAIALLSGEYSAISHQVKKSIIEFSKLYSEW